MKLEELIQRYEATRDQLRAEGHPDADHYAQLVENARKIQAEFMHAQNLTRKAYEKH